jgi:hypothetical protein
MQNTDDGSANCAGTNRFELQSFDCPKCNHELTTEVPEEDPLEKLKGWLFGELGRST